MCVNEHYKDHLLSGYYVLYLGLSFASPPSPEEEGKWALKSHPREPWGKGEGCCKWWHLWHYPHRIDLLCEEIALTINELESFCQCQLQEKTISEGHVDSWSVWAEETMVRGSGGSPYHCLAYYTVYWSFFFLVHSSHLPQIEALGRQGFCPIRFAVISATPSTVSGT